jgi:cell division protein FtsW (lipid II flippase)
MCFWSMIISSVALFVLAAAANAGMTVGLAASEGATWVFLALGLSSLGVAVGQPRLAPAPVAQRTSSR